MNHHFSTNRGFTLIELVVILVLIGILAVFVTSRFGTSNQFDSRGYYDELISATRFAQRYAIASGCPVAIVINANDYSLATQGGSCGVAAVQGPSGDAFAGTAPGGVSVTSGTGTYSFDAYGDSAGGGPVQVQGGGNTHGFVITPVSGYVQ